MYEQIIERLRSSYDGAAQAREASEVDAWKVVERERFLALLRDQDCSTLLEIGAGPGVHGKFFQDEGLKVICTDLSPALVELCRQKGLEAYVRDFLSLDFPEQSFDAMFGMNCLLHVPRVDLSRVLVVLKRMLRAGGLFYWGQYGGLDEEGVWEKDTYEPKRFFSFLTDEHLLEVAVNAFEVIDFRSIEVPREDGLYYQAFVLRR